MILLDGKQVANDRNLVLKELIEKDMLVIIDLQVYRLYWWVKIQQANPMSKAKVKLANLWAFHTSSIN